MDIIILTHIGIHYKVNMDKNSVVKELKLQIRNILGLDFDEQTFMYNNQTINDDNKKLSQYGIIDGCDVKLIVSFKKESFRICIVMQSGVEFDIDVLSKDTLTDVKRKIQGHCQLSPEEQILVYQGLILEGDSDISSFGVQDKSVIHVLHRLVNGLRILVKTVDGKTVSFNVSKFDRIIDIKKKIQEKMKLSSESQRLEYQGEILEDQKTVDECEVSDMSVISVFALPRNGMQISARTMDGKMVSFEVTKSDRIIDIKKKIQENIGLLADEQKLVYQGGLLEDEKTVNEYQIAEKSVINVVARLRIMGIQIFAKTSDGRTIALEVSNNDRVVDIKKKIQEKINLMPVEQKLVFNGLILEDEKTVDECQIAENSVIYVVARSR